MQHKVSLLSKPQGRAHHVQVCGLAFGLCLGLSAPSLAAGSPDKEAAMAFCRKLQEGEVGTCDIDVEKKLISVERKGFEESSLPECGKIADMGADVFPYKAGWKLTIGVETDGQRHVISCEFD
jgi:hypothetical protein